MWDRGSSIPVIQRSDQRSELLAVLLRLERLLQLECIGNSHPCESVQQRPASASVLHIVRVEAVQSVTELGEGVMDKGGEERPGAAGARVESREETSSDTTDSEYTSTCYAGARSRSEQLHRQLINHLELGQLLASPPQRAREVEFALVLEDRQQVCLPRRCCAVRYGWSVSVTQVQPRSYTHVRSGVKAVEAWTGPLEELDWRRDGLRAHVARP